MLSVLTTKGGQRELLEDTDMFITLIVVMVWWVYAYVQTHQVMYIKYMRYFACQLYLNKAVLIFLIDKFLNIYLCIHFKITKINPFHVNVKHYGKKLWKKVFT